MNKFLRILWTMFNWLWGIPYLILCLAIGLAWRPAWAFVKTVIHLFVVLFHNIAVLFKAYKNYIKTGDQYFDITELWF